MSVLKNWLQKLVRASGKHGYTCDSCGEELFDYPTRRICNACENRIEKNGKDVCDKCGRKTISGGVCTTCKALMPRFTCGISPLVYRADTAALVNRIKNGDRRLAFYFAEQMTAAFLRRFAVAGVDFERNLLLVPVPLTDKKRKARGYNQAETLAISVADVLAEKGIPVAVDSCVLQKKRETEQQKNLGVSARAENAVGAYHLHKRKVCEGKTILLIDDILTTGATGSACAKLLLNAGAKEVILLTVASLPERK